MKRREGFTLAEMVIVMAITAIFAATAIHVTGDALEAARNRDRETRFTTALNDAYLKALAQSRTLSEGDSVEAYLSDLSSELAEAVLQDLNAFSKSLMYCGFRPASALPTRNFLMCIDRTSSMIVIPVVCSMYHSIKHPVLEDHCYLFLLAIVHSKGGLGVPSYLPPINRLMITKTSVIVNKL